MSAIGNRYYSVEEVPEGQPFQLYGRGGNQTWVRFPSDGKSRTYGRVNVALSGEYGRRILVDALGWTLEESITNGLAFETEEAKRQRQKRRRDREALAREDQNAKSLSPRKSRW